MRLQMRKFQMAEPFRKNSPGRSGLFDLMPALIMLGLLVCALVMITFAMADKGKGYLVVAPPGWTLAQTVGLVRASGGRLVRPGGFSNVVIAASANPDFGKALETSGALFVRHVPGPLGCDGAQREKVIS